MIKNIKIHNFRCFENIKIQGFKRINLMGGKNNSGKTALLEALYLNNSPTPNTLIRLRKIRGETPEFLKAIPEKAWDNLFFNKKEFGRKAEIISENEAEADNKIEIICDNSVEQFSDMTNNDKSELFDEEIEDLRIMIIESDYKKSILNIYRYIKEKKTVSTSMIASSKGLISKSLALSYTNKVNFIPAFLRISNSALAEEFDKADLDAHAVEVLEAIRLIDDSITQIKTLTIGKPSVYLKRKSDEFLPITLFGEAINRVSQFILKMINNQNGILLIDEIENGIHYTNQHDLWRMLFKLSMEFNIQIFATTHSFEMIRAFSEVAQEENNSGIGTYFEITRNIRTNQIVGIRRVPEVLKYEISQGMEFRGE